MLMLGVRQGVLQKATAETDASGQSVYHNISAFPLNDTHQLPMAT